MKKFTKYLLGFVLAICCVFGLTACGGGEQKAYTEGTFALSSYKLMKNGLEVGTGADVVNTNNVGDTSQYFIELDNNGNMKIMFIELSWSTSTLKYNLNKSIEKNYTYYINSNNKIVAKEGNTTLQYDMVVNAAKTEITVKTPKQGPDGDINALVEMKYTIAD